MNREDFPLLNNYPELIYLDNAATTQKPAAVIKAVNDYYVKTNANVHRGIYSLSEKATVAFEDARRVIAGFINASPEELIFTSGTTMGLNLLAEYYFRPLLNAGDVILLSRMEHHSNIVPWQQIAEKTGAKVIYIPLTRDYDLDLDFLYDTIKKGNVKVLSLTHISNVLGTINPIGEIIKTVKELSPDTLTVIDAAQSVAHLPVDVTELNCDFLVASGHKLYGPTGTGFLYGNKSLLEASGPFFTGGGMIAKVTEFGSTFTGIPARFEAGTPDICGTIALAEAVKYIDQIGFHRISEQEKKLTALLLDELRSLPEVTIYGKKTVENRSGVISFNLAKVHAHDLAQLLDHDNIAVRAGHHCCQILHHDVLQVAATCRASIALYNTEEDIRKLSASIKKIIAAGLFR